MKDLIKIISECESLKQRLGKDNYNKLLIKWTNDFKEKFNHGKYSPNVYMQKQIIYLKRQIELELRKYER